MKFEPHPEASMQGEPIREALNRHWQASAAGDADAEHDIYVDDVICDYPQSGERILGRSNLQASAESSSRQAVRFQRQAHYWNGRSMGHGIHDHLPEAASLHGEHHGI